MKTKIQIDIESMAIDQDLQFVNDDMHGLLSHMEEGLQRVADIVQNITLFAQDNSDNKQFFDINSCIKYTCKMFNRQVNQSTSLALLLQDLPQVEICVDKINQLLTNLLLNAAESIQDNGEIKVISKVKDQQILIHVCDNGSGIPAYAIHKIFDPFYTTKKEGEGTGLGLAISYDIVKEHGGNLTVSSELGKGTVFTIALPLRNAVLH